MIPPASHTVWPKNLIRSGWALWPSILGQTGPDWEEPGELMGLNLGAMACLGGVVGREAANGRGGWAGQLHCQERGGEKPWLLLYKVHRNGEGRAWPQGAPDTAAQGPRAAASGGLGSACSPVHTCPCAQLAALHFSSKLEDVCLEGGLFIFFKEEKQRVALFLCQAKREHSRLAPQELCPPRVGYF